MWPDLSIHADAQQRALPSVARVGGRSPSCQASQYTCPMAVDVVTSTVIARPCSEVAAFASDPDNAPRWYKNIRSVRWVTEPPLRVGSRIAFVAHFLGRKLSYTYEVSEFSPGRRFVMRTAEGPFPMETSYEWHAEGPGSTRMVLRNRGEPTGFSAMVAPFMSWAMRRANAKDLAALRALLETSSERRNVPSDV